MQTAYKKSVRLIVSGTAKRKSGLYGRSSMDCRCGFAPATTPLHLLLRLPDAYVEYEITQFGACRQTAAGILLRQRFPQSEVNEIAGRCFEHYVTVGGLFVEYPP